MWEPMPNMQIPKVSEIKLNKLFQQFLFFLSYFRIDWILTYFSFLQIYIWMLYAFIRRINLISFFFNHMAYVNIWLFTHMYIKNINDILHWALNYIFWNWIVKYHSVCHKIRNINKVLFRKYLTGEGIDGKWCFISHVTTFEILMPNYICINSLFTSIKQHSTNIT